jgi:hypothetical protein
MVLSGPVATWVSWRWIFIVPLLVAGFALLSMPRLPPAPPHGRQGTLDLPGALLATSAVTLRRVTHDGDMATAISPGVALSPRALVAA